MERTKTMSYYYKIMDYEQGQLKTLFHGLNGSRTVPMFKWLQADVKEVFDGSTGTRYMSGWHVFDSHDECKEYLKLFTKVKNKVIARCKVKGKMWPKSHSRSNVQLAEWLYIVGVAKGGKKL